MTKTAPMPNPNKIVTEARDDSDKGTWLASNREIQDKLIPPTTPLTECSPPRAPEKKTSSRLSTHLIAPTHSLPHLYRTRPSTPGSQAYIHTDARAHTYIDARVPNPSPPSLVLLGRTVFTHRFLLHLPTSDRFFLPPLPLPSRSIPLRYLTYLHAESLTLAVSAQPPSLRPISVCTPVNRLRLALSLAYTPPSPSMRAA